MKRINIAGNMKTPREWQIKATEKALIWFLKKNKNIF